MVGKSNLPPDVDKRAHLHGAARTSPGHTALDEEREASMADEGGVSGAMMESQEAPGEAGGGGDREGGGSFLPKAVILGSAFVLGALAALTLAALWRGED